MRVRALSLSRSLALSLSRARSLTLTYATPSCCSLMLTLVTQAALLGSAFYFLFHTSTPLIVHWATEGKTSDLVWEMDFAYFYSSAIVGAAIGIFFMVALPLSLPFVALLFTARYYTDKWQLLTAHSNLRPDPAPGSCSSPLLSDH